MRSPFAVLLAPFVLCLAASPSAPQSSAQAPAQTPSASVSCRFSNPGYSGYCTESVDVGRGQTQAQACRAVLSCLNNAQCTRTYCTATTIRSGWRLEEITSIR